MLPKTITLVPVKYRQELVVNADTDRMLASGSYLIGIKPKTPSAHCLAQKEFEQRRREAGFKKLQVLLPEAIFNKLRDRLLDGESMASLLERLLSVYDTHNNSISQPPE